MLAVSTLPELRPSLDVSRIEITNHAVERYRQRTGCKQSDDEIRERIRQRLKASEEVQHKTPQLAALSIMKHGFTKAKYYDHGGLIFVVVNERALVTLHKGEAGRWKRC